jgi:hypothetical protein
VAPERVEVQEAWLAEHHVEHKLIRFEGGHHLNQYVLKDLAKEA